MKKETFTLQRYWYNEYKKIRTWLQKESIDCTNYVVIFVIINDYVHFFPPVQAHVPVITHYLFLQKYIYVH